MHAHPLALLTLSRCSPSRVFLCRFVCGSVDPSSVQAGVVLRTLLGCGAAASAEKFGVLEQIQGFLSDSDGPPGIEESLYCDWEFLTGKLWNRMENEEEYQADLRRLERTDLGGGEFVKSFPVLPDVERRTSAEVHRAFEKDVQGKIKVKRALFEHAQDAVVGAFVRSARTIGTRSTSKVTTSSSSSSSASVAARAAKRRAVLPAASSRNLAGLERVLSGWQTAAEVLLDGDPVKNIPKEEEDMWDY